MTILARHILGRVGHDKEVSCQTIIVPKSDPTATECDTDSRECYSLCRPDLLRPRTVLKVYASFTTREMGISAAVAQLLLESHT